MYQLRHYLFLLIIVGFVVASVTGGWYVWSTFKSVQSGLPIEVLKLHRNLSGQIQVLSNLTGKLSQAQADTSRANLDELTFALDAAFVTKTSLNIGTLANNNQKFKMIEIEINGLLDSIEGLLDNDPPFDTLRAMLLHTRLTYALSELENSYLAVNEKTLLALIEQSQALDQLRGNTLVLLGIIASAIIIVLILLMWSNRVNTHLHDARNKLIHQTDLLRAMLESIDQGFAVWDVKDRLILWSDRCLDFWNQPKELHVGTTRSDLLLHLAEQGIFGEGDSQEIASQQLQRIHEMERDSEEHLHMNDGRYVHLQRYPMPDGGTAVVYTDITEHKNWEDALASTNERLKELDKLKSMFIASMSHELRTPLNSIIGFTGLVLEGVEGDINDLQREDLTRVKKAGRHLLALISDVIDISKIESGRLEVFPETIIFGEVLDEAVGAIEPEAIKKGLSITVDSPQDLKMYTDRKRLLQCLLNYLSNAVKYSEMGTIRVLVQEVDGIVEIAVSDTGIGIAEEDMPRLFDAFERMDSHLRVRAGGTGLGLYLTRKIASEMLGGVAHGESELGKGSTFYLKVMKMLPTKKTEQDEEEVVTS